MTTTAIQYTPDYISLTEARNIMGISRSLFFKKIRPVIPAVVVGRRVLIPREKFLEFLNQMVVVQADFDRDANGKDYIEEWEDEED